MSQASRASRFGRPSDRGRPVESRNRPIPARDHASHTALERVSQYNTGDQSERPPSFPREIRAISSLTCLTSRGEESIRDFMRHDHHALIENGLMISRINTSGFLDWKYCTLGKIPYKIEMICLYG